MGEKRKFSGLCLILGLVSRSGDLARGIPALFHLREWMEQMAFLRQFNLAEKMPQKCPIIVRKAPYKRIGTSLPLSMGALLRGLEVVQSAWAIFCRVDGAFSWRPFVRFGRWAPHSRPTMNEPEKAVCWLTPDKIRCSTRWKPPTWRLTPPWGRLIMHSNSSCDGQAYLDVFRCAHNFCITNDKVEVGDAYEAGPPGAVLQRCALTGQAPAAAA